MAFGNAQAERRAIETTYEDIATVSRAVQQTGGDKITRAVPEMVYSDVICALSYSGSDKSKQTKAENQIDYDAVVFMAPELAVRPGDKVTVTRFGRDNPGSQIMLTFEVVGRPPVYATHQEVKVRDGDIS